MHALVEPRCSSILAPRWSFAAAGRPDPDLEQSGRYVFAVVFGMNDAGASAHYLDVAGSRAAFVAQTILVGDRAGAHESDDFHVVMRMRGKAGAGRNGVIVPNPDCAPAHAGGIAVVGEREVMAGIKPAVIGVAKASEWTDFDHGIFQPRRGVFAGIVRRWEFATKGSRRPTN